jgi:hypothetical protein
MAFLTPNEVWAIEQIIVLMEDKKVAPEHKVTKKDIRSINGALNKLDTILYKSWSKDLTLNELRNVIREVIAERGIDVDRE